MPRETIRPFRLPGTIIGGDDDGKPAESIPAMVIDIGWNNGIPGISVTTTAPKDAGRIMLEMVNDWLSHAEMPTIDIEKLLTADPGFGWRDAGTFHSHLDIREDVNRLIRVLRRARDCAFGKDA